MHEKLDRKKIRFHIVVLNYNRIESFLNYFNKIKNFDKERDQILIVDCSSNYKSERQKVLFFCKKNELIFDVHVYFVRRKNWGIDQGARIDYFSYLRKIKITPDYIWQFQEHYLDLETKNSWWGANVKNVDGKELSYQIKGDTIPDNFIIDLNECESIYKSNLQIGVIYANREGVGLFSDGDHEWFYTDGANFSARTTLVIEAFDEAKLNLFRLIYDATYTFTLFCEFHICLQLNKSNQLWYDLVNRTSLNITYSPSDNKKKIRPLVYHTAEKEYIPLYNSYLARWEKRKNEGPVYKLILLIIHQLKTMFTSFKK